MKNKLTIAISARGRVTLKIDVAELADLLGDAAVGEATHHLRPNREVIESLAEVVADWFELHHPDASETMLLKDVRDAYNEPTEPTSLEAGDFPKGDPRNP